MAITMAASPERPLPGRDVRLTFTATTGNYFKLFCTGGPVGSELQNQLDTKAATRIPVLEGDTGRPHVFQPDRGGVFTFVVQELTKGASTYGGGYQGAPGTHRSETIIGESTVTLTVGQRLTCRVGLPGDQATLAVHVWGDSIRPTTVQTHGEKTPAITDANSARARTAIETTTVRAALEALTDETAADVLGSYNDVATALIDAFNGHLGDAGHATADTYSAINASYRNPQTHRALPFTLAEIQRKLDRHLRTDHGDYYEPAADPEDPDIYHPGGTGSGDWHAPSGSVVSDWTNAITASGVSGQNEQLNLLAHLWHAYEQHRQSTAVHSTADTTNAAGPLPALLELFRVFVNETRTSTPTVPTTANPGVLPLITWAGAVDA